MNKVRRKGISKIAKELEVLKDRIEDIKTEEEEYHDNIPENLEMSDRAMESEEAIDKLDEIMETIDEAIDGLEELT